jgi:GT2 family glycosyltransferase
MRTLSVLVVNYFTASLVHDLVLSIGEYIKRYEFEILICDNSVDDEQRRELQKLDRSNVSLFCPRKNLGFVGANNYLFKKAQHDLLLLINPDTKLIDSSMEKLFDFVGEGEGIGVAGPRLLNGDGTVQVGHYRFPDLMGLIKEHLLLVKQHPYAYKDSTSTVECDVVKGACLVIKKDVAKSVGLFDLDFAMYSEEVDLCFRLKERGLKNFFYPSARIIHYGEKSARQKQFTEYSLYHYHRSRLLYFKKHHSQSYYLVVKFIILISLVEKTVVFFFAGKGFSSRVHLAVLWRIFFRSPESPQLLR